MKKSYALTLLPLLLVGCSAHIEMTDHVNSGPVHKIIYVNHLQKQQADGTSWQSAYSNLSDALHDALPGDEIRVARGIYLPSQNNDRTAAFLLKKDVKIYGGFRGDEEERADRDVENNPTILSGNIGDSESALDDSFNVVVGDVEMLDGITLQKGGEQPWDSSRLTIPRTRVTMTENIQTTPLPESGKARRIYVDAAAEEGGDGSSWEQAMNRLQPALDAASAGGAEVWVAEGRYLPEDTGRSATFLIRDGVHLYGSMKAGTTNRKTADTVATPTILSGNIGAEDLHEDNAYHVVTAGNNVVLTGVKIAGGQADGDGSNALGGGLTTFHRAGTPFAITLDRVIFEDNHATLGGAWFADGVKATLKTTYFKENRALYGGAIAAGAGTGLNLDNVHFFANQATFAGGALYLDDGASVHGTHCLFTNNRAKKAGGAVVVSGEDGAQDTTRLHLNDTLFSGNRGGLFGGALTAAGTAQATVQYSHLHDNFATNGGDIATLAGGILRLRDCVFIDEEGQQVFRGK